MRWALPGYVNYLDYIYMNSKFILLSCDDVVLLEREAFKVSRLKHLIQEGIKIKLSHYVYDNKNEQRTHYNVKTSLSGVGIIGEYIGFNEIQFNSIQDCQILKIGSQGWQKGKLKINICISPYGNNLDPVCLEFYPDTPTKMESSLGDIRKLVENGSPALPTKILFKGNAHHNII